MSRVPWPVNLDLAQDARVGVVIVNYNTRELLAQVIYSLYRYVHSPRFHLVVVDNASTDDSPALLTALSDAGMCDAIFNRAQQYHGPGLNQGFDHLARRQGIVAARDRLRAVWVLDSDCVVMREDALSAAVDVMHGTGAGIVGQWVEDQWHHGDMMGLHSLLLDPGRVWQRTITPFQEHGNPSEALQRSATRAGIVSAEFPFTRGGYVVHIGRGTLRSIAQHDEQANRYFIWATDHNEPHFVLEAEAPARYRRFLEEFRADVGAVYAESLIEACARYR